MRLLLVEDDPLVGDGIHTGLSQQGCAVDWVMDGLNGEHALATEDYEVVILDLNLPKRDGITVLKNLRTTNNNVPVLVLTARSGIEDRIAGLDSGADDYMIKPFDLNELYARIRVLIRRRNGRSSSLIKHGDIELDPSTHTVRRRNREITLSRREFSVLHQLLENEGKVLSRSRLEDSLYAWSDEVESNTVEVHVHHIRKKLGSHLIRTIRGVGYVVGDTP